MGFIYIPLWTQLRSKFIKLTGPSLHFKHRYQLLADLSPWMSHKHFIFNITKENLCSHHTMATQLNLSFNQSPHLSKRHTPGVKDSLDSSPGPSLPYQSNASKLPFRLPISLFSLFATAWKMDTASRFTSLFSSHPLQAIFYLGAWSEFPATHVSNNDDKILIYTVYCGSHIGFWALEIWLVWIEMFYEYKICNEFQRLRKSENISLMCSYWLHAEIIFWIYWIKQYI